ncbi:MAG: cobyrinate a,c-diamide synthase [Candidatus Calescibacterium sp.]|nr:cobyrinate a,c-diamide synthase [Candidatus Calescibacterium sp.]MCX7733906.1 cobyrinate a,c-diamide synthase [bacterium]MDW8086496.1 cobyrinate a,c-diamide synthase [Candidatus Calescibacterium sp.]
MKTVLISGISSNSGKTVVSLCIESGLQKLGKKFTAFKFGPDFIDPSYHRLFAECYNLDPVMSSPDFVKYLFATKSSEYNLIEGAMGIFDGETYGSSTYDLSKILGAKIILCIDVFAMGESIRAIAKGLKDVISGIVAVKVGSEHHLEIITKALEKENVKLLGYLPKSEKFEIPSRHLGLYLADEVKQKIKKDELQDIFFKFFDVDQIMKIFDQSDVRFEYSQDIENKIFGSVNYESLKKRKVAILSGSYFPFIYPENIFILRRLGFDVYEIELDQKPLDFDVLFIPGGYPENFADEMEEIVAKLMEFLKIPKLVVAECGGLEILSSKILYNGREIKCAGVFPFEIKIEEKLQALGWRKLENKNKEVWQKGHEFHYGKISNINPEGIFLKYDSKGRLLGSDGFVKEKFIALWTHLYFGSNPKSIAELISSCSVGGISN